MWIALPAVGVAAVAVLVFIFVRDSGGSRLSSTRRAPASTVPPTASTVPAPTTAPLGTVPPVVSKVPTSDPVVFFTIDDGLVRDPKVVDFLKQHKIPVTMFLIPEPAREGEAYFKQIQALGGTIQDHTQNHRDLAKLGPGAQQREVCGPLDDYATRFGQRPWMFRPPNGDYDSTTKGAVRVCGLRELVLWTGSTNDGRLDLQHPGPLQPGDIILMHFRTDLRRNLEVALNAAHAAGLTPGRLDHYLPSS